MIMSIVQTRAKQLQRLRLLTPSVVYDEEKQIVYLGCNLDSVKGYLSSLKTFYRCEKIEVQKAKHTNFDREIVILDMQQ